MNRPRPLQMEEIPLWNILVDVVIIGLSLSSTVIMVKTVKPFQDGFFCNDDSIRYPYKSSTITIAQLYIVAVVIPVLTMVAVELWANRREKLRRQILIAGWVVPEWIVHLMRQILLFGYGLGCLELAINVAKFTVGRLRPHFLDACRPDVLCNAADPHTYITDYTCTGGNKFAVFHSRLSFPSGHSSLAFYAAVFTVIFLEKRIRWPNRAVVLKTAFEVLVLTMAWYTALTRISDRKHHWQDVAVGCLLGGVVAFIWVWKVMRVRPRSESDSGVAADHNSKGPSDAATYMFPTEDSCPNNM